MAAPRILWRYISRDVFAHTLLGLSVITLVLVVANLLRHLERLFAVGVDASDVLLLMGIILPTYLPYALPTSLLFGVLVSLGRMSADGEIIAMRASGISVYRLLPPVLALGLLAAAPTAYLLFEVEPNAYRETKLLLRVLSQSARVVEPGRFIALGDHTVYVHATGDSDCPLEGVLIGDGSSAEEPRYIAARCGTVREDPESAALVLGLQGGSIHFGHSDAGRYRRILFSDGSVHVDVRDYLNPLRRAREYTFSELLELRARYARGDPPRLRDRDGAVAVDLQLHRRAAFGAASLAFALLAIPLGIQPLRAGRSWGALTAVGVMALYYAALMFGERIGTAGWVPISLAVWIPNTLVVALALVLLQRSLRRDS